MIVLGNGFDKACGLQSSFCDYYRARIQKDAELFISNVINDSDDFDAIFSMTDANNIWAIIFALQLSNYSEYKWSMNPNPFYNGVSEINWMDIESLIYLVLTQKPNNLDYLLLLVEKSTTEEFYNRKKMERS